MRKLILLSVSVLFSIGLIAQKSNFTGSDDQLEYKVSIEELKDQKNDRFYAYYSLEIKNTSNSEVSFTPIFNYKTSEGSIKSSLTHDHGNQVITLGPGETIKGNLKNKNQLTLFKEFLIGNSGKKAADAFNHLESVSINY